MNRGKALLCALSALALAGCEDDLVTDLGPRGSGAFARYVAIGTSLSAGYQSNGIFYASQQQSWPAYLARQAFASSFDQPYIVGPGCAPPLVAPLQLARLLSGVALTQGDSSCAAVFSTVELPANNVAMPGALAATALLGLPPVPGTGSSLAERLVYSRIVSKGQTQVTAMTAQHPTFVSVELGGFDLLPAAIQGVLIAHAGPVPTAPFEPEQIPTDFTYVPAPVFNAFYAAVIDSVRRSGARAVLVTVPSPGLLSTLYRGEQLYADRASLQQFGIIASANCSGSQNLVFVPSKILSLIAAARLTGQPQSLDCADAPGVADAVLTPADTSTLGAAARAMSTHVRTLASTNGYAVLEADDLLADLLAARPAFDVKKMLGCSRPFGPYVSLDGVHLSGLGNQLLANAAIVAIDERYGFELPEIEIVAPTDPQGCS